MNSLLPNKNTLIIALSVALILAIPLIAMQFTDEVAWSPFDFAFAGALLFGAGLAFELLTRRAGSTAYRAAVGLALAGVLLLVWVNLAVGILGSEDNPANVVYLGVLAVLFLGALLARLQPQGMARALYATALAQALALVIGLLVWRPAVSSGEALPELLKVVGVNGLFFLIWVGPGLLFRRAAAAQKVQQE